MNDAVGQNDSGRSRLGDDTLKAIAQDLVAVVQRNATIDRDKKEQVGASLRRYICRMLAKCKYLPDKQESAVAMVCSKRSCLPSRSWREPQRRRQLSGNPNGNPAGWTLVATCRVGGQVIWNDTDVPWKRLLIN